MFTIQVPTTPKTQLLTYDEINTCVTLHVACLRIGKCSNYQNLLCLNLELENQLSHIVGKCPYYKFIERPKNITIQAFIVSTFFQQKLTIGDNDNNDDQPIADTNAKSKSDANAEAEAEVVVDAEALAE